MRKTLLLVICFSLTVLNLWAQKSITGKVLDDKGQPVVGASIIEKSSKAGTSTDAKGNFTLTVPATAKTLTISGVGFASMEVSVNQATSITLTATDNVIDEVVVTGYTREKRTKFAGAAAVVSGKVVETTPVGSFDQALQGRVAGMLVNSSSGQPGSSATVTIRGVQSIQGAGAQPLYILDGVPISAGDFQTLNPNDFESFNVLKDASAAALYGARAGTGVIVITTKRGKAGATKMMVRGQVGVTKAPDFSRLNMMNTSEILQYEERLGIALGNVANNPNTPGWVYSKKNPTYATASATEQARRDFLLDSIGNIDVDYADVFYRQGLSQSYEVNMSGGNDKTRFFLSGNYFDQEGIDMGSALTRYTARMNLEHTANRLTVSWNTLVGYSKTNFSEGEALGNSARNPFQMTYRAKPYEDPYRADGSVIYGASTTLALKQVGNLVEGIQNSSLAQDQVKINTGINLAYKILPSLTVRNMLGIDMANDLWQRYIKPASYIGSLQTFQSGIDVEANKINTQLINTTSAVFNKRINEVHELEVGAYFEVIRSWQKGIGFTLYNLDPRLSYTGQGAGTLPTNGAATYPQNSTSAKSGYGIRSYFANARYTYNGKYTITGSIRRDGTSRIANDENKEITTWSAGAIWNVMQEDFMKSQNILTDLSVRASYGSVPNIGSIATGSYTILGTGGATWVSVTNYLGPQVPSFSTSGGAYAGSSITGQVPSSPGNPSLKIETIEKTNIGVDFALWKSRARFTIDLYKNKTVDLFVSNPLSATTGFGSTNINAGVMTNKGFEGTVSVDVVRQKDFNVNIGWNHSININKIEDLGLVNEYFLGTFVIREGLPYGSHYTYNYLGANPADGKPLFETADGKETTDAAKAGQFAKFGTYLPKHVGGFNGDISFKGFSLSAFFTYQFDVVRSNNIRNWITRGTSGYHTSVNASKELLTKQWQKAGDVALFQDPNYDRGFTSSDLEDGKFLRFRTLIVSYQVPAINAKGMSIIKGARIYAQMQNVHVWSKWTGLDPEDGNNISLNEYPNPTQIVGGIDINF